MTTTFILRCALIGAITALIIRIIILFIQKQPRATWSPLDEARGSLANSWLVTFLNENKFVLLKNTISGALLGMAGGYVGYMASTWVAGLSQHWLMLLLSAIIAVFITRWVLPVGKLWVRFYCASNWFGGGWAGDNRIVFFDGWISGGFCCIQKSARFSKPG